MIKSAMKIIFFLSNLKKIQRKFLEKIVDGWIYGGTNMDTNVKDTVGKVSKLQTHHFLNGKIHFH